MRTKAITGNKADRIIFSCRNMDVSAIPRGTPVLLQITAGTPADTDGLGVVLPSTGGAGSVQSLNFGVTTTALAPGDDGEVVVFGITNGNVQKVTRANSTSSWPSAASVAKGPVKIDVANNIYIPAATSDPTAGYLLDDAPAVAGVTSIAGDTRLIQNIGARILIRTL